MSRRQRNRRIGTPERCIDTTWYKGEPFRCLLATGHEGDHEGCHMIGDQVVEVQWGDVWQAAKSFKNEIHEGELP